MLYVMVLNDGETYSDLSGCQIVAVPENVPVDLIEDFLRGEPEVITRFD